MPLPVGVISNLNKKKSKILMLVSVQALGNYFPSTSMLLPKEHSN
jgi:hypothetical protein